MDKFWNDAKASGFLKFLPPLKHKLYKKVASIIKAGDCEHVMDYGCGEGNQIHFLPNRLKIGVYDINKDVVKSTVERFIDTRNIYQVSRITKELNSAYDAIIVNMVWMCLNEKEIESLFKRIKLIKKKNGIIIITMTHPCFRDNSFSYYETDFSISKRKFNYFNNGESFQLIVKNKEKTAFRDYHYSLTYFLSKTKKHDLVLSDFIEMKDETFKNFSNQFASPYLITVFK